MLIRRYLPGDKVKVIDLLLRNTPGFFHPSEEQDLCTYLEYEAEDYFVATEGADIVGAGGINYFPEEKTARISWDIIAPERQSKGIGRSLTEYRLGLLKQNLSVEFIVVRTSQLSYRFYEKMGFELEKIEKDFWAENFHLYLMRQVNKKDAIPYI